MKRNNFARDWNSRSEGGRRALRASDVDVDDDDDDDDDDDARITRPPPKSPNPTSLPHFISDRAGSILTLKNRKLIIITKRIDTSYGELIHGMNPGHT